MSPVWRILLLAGVAATATQPAMAGAYGGGFIEFMLGGAQSGPSRDPFAPQPRMQEPGAPAPSANRALRSSPTDFNRPAQLANYGAAPVETRRSVPTEYLRTEVDYSTQERPGTIIVDTSDKHLYLVQSGGRAIRYGIGVGRPGFTWAGVKTVSRKAEWPGWTPPQEMLKRRPDLPKYMEGGPSNPLGARALYLGSSLYRIHGTNEPYTIGQNVSSGCIRMMNQDVQDLYDRVKVGTKVIVL
ncbi:MAG: L,D-transpeptidase [Rhodoblastus sp.]